MCYLITKPEKELQPFWRISFFFHRIFELFPLKPSATKRADILESEFQEFPNHAGTGLLSGSGTVEYELLVPYIFVSPGLYVIGIFPNGTRYFNVA